MSYKKDGKNQEQQKSRKNPELWSFKTWVLETTPSDLFGRTLGVDHDSYQQS